LYVLRIAADDGKVNGSFEKPASFDSVEVGTIYSSSVTSSEAREVTQGVIVVECT
jgi:hypothetical protein